ncbi:MAG: alpha/beta fold hydrolase [Gammaproteobacteria bacterium]|nr:alpha/beta fold hydrolase [Gammaproteobacteria bacterium]
MPIAKVGGLDVCYERFGSGPDLLFISGTGGDLRVRPGVLDTPLAAQFSVTAYDQRGLGRTAKPVGPYTMRDYAADALGLLDYLELSRVRVIGVSFGGMVAQELALLAPARIERLVLCCTSAGGAGGASYPLHELAALPGPERARRGLALGDTRRTDEWRAANPDVVARIDQQAAAAAAVGADDPDKARGADLQLAARANHDTWQRLSGMTVPTLLCAGRYDGIAPMANMEAMAVQIPSARLEVFEGGHLFLIQDRRANPTIASWLLD